MPSQEVVVSMIERMAQNCPTAIFENLDFYRAGVGCVLHFLSTLGRPVTAGEISQHMKVSTARVAVLLRKMDERNLICRQRDSHDARRTLICLSPTGEDIYRQAQQHFIDLMCFVVDQVGEDKMEQFISISAEIKKTIACEGGSIVPSALIDR